MNDNVLTDEQWLELWEAVDIFDQKGDRTILNQVLVSIMTNTIESLDDDDGCQTSEDNGMEKQLVITLIESELAEIIAVKACPIWCCRRQRIQPFSPISHNKFSDYLIHLARAKSFDKINSGFISKENILLCFGAQLSDGKMAELLQFVEINKDGNINYRDFAILMLITRYSH